MVIDLAAKRTERHTNRATALIALHIVLTGIADLNRDLREALHALTLPLTPEEEKEARLRVGDLILRREIMYELARAQEKKAKALGKVPAIAGL